MWFLLALAAMVCWSGSDIFSKVGTEQNDKYSHLKMVMCVGFVMGLHAFISILTGVDITFADIIKYLPVSAFYISSMVLGYVGLRYIELSISSPVCNSSGAICAVLCFLFLGQSLGALSLVGVILISLGVVALGIIEASEDDEVRMLRQSESNRKYSKGFLALGLPILYCLLDALGTFADALILDGESAFGGRLSVVPLEEEVANTAYELTFLLMGILSFIYVFIVKKQKITKKCGAFMGTAAVCETLGQFAYVYALADYAIGAAPIVSAYSVISAVFGRLFLKEKLSYKHYLAIGAVFVGILILGIVEGLG